MVAVVQVILTTWCKQFRGGPRARARNAVPEAEPLILPAGMPAVPSFVLHGSKHSFGSVPGMGRLPGPPVQVIPADEPLQVGAVRVRWTGERLGVDYLWTSDGGTPKRHSRNDVLVLGAGEWGRVSYHSRHSPARRWEAGISGSGGTRSGSSTSVSSLPRTKGTS